MAKGSAKARASDPRARRSSRIAGSRRSRALAAALKRERRPPRGWKPRGRGRDPSRPPGRRHRALPEVATAAPEPARPKPAAKATPAKAAAGAGRGETRPASLPPGEPGEGRREGCPGRSPPPKAAPAKPAARPPPNQLLQGPREARRQAGPAKPPRSPPPGRRPVPRPPGTSRRTVRRSLRPLSGRRRARIYAAVDVGANSVHLLVAAVHGHRLEPLVDESVLLGLGDTVEAHEGIPEPHRGVLVAELARYAGRARDAGRRRCLRGDAAAVAPVTVARWCRPWRTPPASRSTSSTTQRKGSEPPRCDGRPLDRDVRRRGGHRRGSARWSS
jgi:hypothetical protein